MSYKIDQFSNWMAGKAEVAHTASQHGPSSPTDVHDDFEKLVVEVACIYCGSQRKGPSRTVSIDTLDLDTCAILRRNSCTALRTVAVDTSDLDVHYEFYKREQTRMSKSVATDTYDLSCKKTVLRSSSSVKNYKNISNCKTASPGVKGHTLNSAQYRCEAHINVRNQNISVSDNIKSDVVLNCETSFEQYSDNTGSGGLSLVNENIFENDSRLGIGNDILCQNELQVRKNSQSNRNATESNANDCNHPINEGTGGDENDGCFSVSGHYDNKIETDGKFQAELDDAVQASHDPLLYDCNVCGASFTCKQVLSDHLADHDVALSDGVQPVDTRIIHHHSVGVGPYECQLCSRRFVVEKQLKLHHCTLTRTECIACEVCMQQFSSSGTLHEHMQTFHQEFKLKSGCGVWNSKEIGKGSEGKTVVFEDTGQSENCRQNLRKELDSFSHRISSKIRECAISNASSGGGVCNESISVGNVKKRFKKGANIVVKKKSPRTPIECLTCGKSFRGWTALKNHETVHTGERNFVCEICNKAFPTKACLKSHGSTHTGLKPFVCTTCGKAFAHKDSLRTHIRTHTGERPFTCDLCGQAFNRSFTLNMHRRTHTGEKKHICSSCGQAFTTNSALRSHERRKHSTNPPPKVHRVYKRCSKDPYICDVCGKACTSSANLRFHSANHTGIKPFGCTVCGKSYPMKQTLQRHMMKHTGERPFVCDVCGMAFFRSTTLNIHKLRHTGEKPHVCSLCGKGFIQSSSLSYHIRNHNRLPKPEPKAKRRKKRQKDSASNSGDCVLEQVSHIQSLSSTPVFQEQFGYIKNHNFDTDSEAQIHFTGVLKRQTNCKAYIHVQNTSNVHMNQLP